VFDSHLASLWLILSRFKLWGKLYYVKGVDAQSRTGDLLVRSEMPCLPAGRASPTAVVGEEYKISIPTSSSLRVSILRTEAISLHKYIRHNFTSSDCGEAVLKLWLVRFLCHSGLDPESIQMNPPRHINTR